MSNLLKNLVFFLFGSLIISAALISCRLNTPPLVEIDQGNQVSVVNGATAEFTTTVTDPDEGQSITYQWYVDGETVDGETNDDFGYVTGPVQNPKTYTISVIATDEKGGEGEDSAELTVNPADFYPLDQTGSFEFSIDLGSSPRDVYFLFTNITDFDQTTLPSVTQAIGNRSLTAPSLSSRPSAPAAEKPIARRGAPEISEFNNGPHDLGRRVDSRDLYGGEPEPPLFYQVGVDEASFRAFNRAGYSTVDATFGGSASANGKTLNVWVQNEHWDGSAPVGETHVINSDMVQALADKFLKTGDGNDIYEWISGIFGDEWGPPEYDNLIPANDEITILLYDIDSDEMPGSGDSRIVGLFDSIHNFKQSYYTISNEKIMFGLDAVLFADDTEGGGWSLEDSWPQEVVSTLAHEFQHMIHFYQKNILRGGSPDIWLNEMCSVMAEDLVADKMYVPGPRGVDPSDGTAGSGGNTSGRLPLFNYYNDYSLITWNSNVEDYSLVYSFGAYLGRNFGGAELFRHIVQNAEGDDKAVEYALDTMDYDYTFTDVLRRWGVAVMYSDFQNAPVDLEYNKGDWFTSASGGTTYKLGSINLYNYEYNDDSPPGPYFYDRSPVGEWGTHYKTATSYYEAGSGLTGQNSWNIDIPAAIRLTVVLK